MILEKIMTKNHDEIPDMFNLAELPVVNPQTMAKAVILGKETHSKLFLEIKHLGIC